MDTTIMRNVCLLRDVLSGKSYTECAKKYELSMPSVANNMRFILRHIREHTDLDMLDSANYFYVMEHKEQIEKYLAEPFPKTIITLPAKTYLQKKFTKYYSRQIESIAAAWPDICKAFVLFKERRDLLSIQNWLSYEGITVGKRLSTGMLDFVFKQFKTALLPIQSSDGQFAFAVKNIDRTDSSSKFIIDVETKEKDRLVTRQFLVDLVPDQL